MTDAPLHAEGITLLGDLIGGRRVAMLTTRTVDGGLASCPHALPERAFDGSLWFISRADAPQVADIEADPLVNVSLSDGTALSLNGRALISDDPRLKRRAWDDVMAQWFGCGPDDPALVLIIVEVLAAEYWELPGRPPTLIPLVRDVVDVGRPALDGDEELSD